MKSSDFRPEHFENGRSFDRAVFDEYIQASSDVTKNYFTKYLPCVAAGLAVSYLFSHFVGGIIGNILALACIFGGLLGGLAITISGTKKVNQLSASLGITKKDVALARKHIKKGTVAWSETDNKNEVVSAKQEGKTATPQSDRFSAMPSNVPSESEPSGKIPSVSAPQTCTEKDSFDSIMAPFFSFNESLFRVASELEEELNAKENALYELMNKGENGIRYLSDFLMKDAVIINNRYTIPSQGNRTSIMYYDKSMVAQTLGDKENDYAAEMLEKIMLCTSSDTTFAISLQIACANSLGRMRKYDSLIKIVNSGQNVPAVRVAKDYLRLHEQNKDTIEINQRDATGNAPIHKAMGKANETELIQDLIDQGADLDIIRADRENTGWTALFEAVLYKHTETAVLLLKNGADPNISDLYGSFPLQRAAAMGEKSFVELLLSHGADVTQKTLTGKSALDWALQNDHAEIAQILQNIS